MSEYLEKIGEEYHVASGKYTQLLADDVMDRFVLDEAMMEAYEKGEKYISALETEVRMLESNAN